MSNAFLHQCVYDSTNGVSHNLQYHDNIMYRVQNRTLSLRSLRCSLLAPWQLQMSWHSQKYFASHCSVLFTLIHHGRTTRKKIFGPKMWFRKFLGSAKIF